MIRIIFILICFNFIGCNIGTRIESSLDSRNRVVILKELTKISIRFYEGDELMVNYIHYLFLDPMAREYRACMFLMIYGEDRINRICVDHRGRVKDVGTGSDENNLTRHSCHLQRNHQLCQLMQSDFDNTYEDLEIERHINETLWSDLD